MNRTSDKYQIAQFRATNLKDHRLAPAETKSWLVSSHGQKGSYYWYTVTWSYPGVLTVSGDIGNITLTHYHAMDTWVAAADWISCNSDHHYLLSKSDHKQVYDPEQTLETILQWANEEIPDRSDEDEDDELCCIFEKTSPYGAEIKSQDKANSDWYPGIDRLRVTAPDGWKLWLKILKAVSEHHKPNDIFTETGRQELTDLLREALETDHDSAADLTRRLDLDDYYGSYSWSNNSLKLIAALYHWAALVRDGVEFTDEYTRLRNRAELADQVRMLDQSMAPDRHRIPYKYLPGVVECRIGNQIPTY